MYARNLGGREFTFDFASGLIDDNLLVVDRETDSVWSQLAGAAVFGEMEGTPLEALPSLQTTWKYWRERHPSTRVMVIEDREGRPYLYQDFIPGERRSRAGAHDISTLGLGFAAGDESWFFPLTELAKAPSPLVMTVADQQITVHYDGDGMTGWIENGAGELQVAVIAYERGWKSFFPDSKRFAAGR